MAPQISAPEVSQLFERSTAVSRKELQARGHSILALPLAAGIMRAHGAKFSVDTGVNGECVYRFDFDLSKAKALA